MTLIVGVGDFGIGALAIQAESARDTAVTAKDNAVIAKTAAETAQSAAQTAETGAVAAKNSAETASSAAVTAKNAAQTAETGAVAAKNSAETAQTGAQTAKTQAESARDTAYAYSLSASGYANLTSVSSVTIAIGTNVFTTNKASTATAFAVGQRVRIANPADPTKYMEGIISDFTSATLTVSIDLIGGSGTFSSWNITAAGQKGADGASPTLGGSASFVQKLNPSASGFINSTIYDNGSGVAIGGTSITQTFNIHNTYASSSLNSSSGNFAYHALYNGATGGGLILGIEGSSGGNLVAGTTAYSGVLDRQGIYDLFLATNGTPRVGVLSSGRILMGPTLLTDDGTSALQVSGNIKLKGPGTYAGLLLDNTGASGGSYISLKQNGVVSGLIGVNGSIQGDTSMDLGILCDFAGGGIKFYTNGSPTVKAMLSSVGYLVVGYTNPVSSDKLQINGSGYFSSGVTAVSFNGYLQTSGTNQEGRISYNGAYGLLMQGKSAAISDSALFTPSGSVIWENATGTLDIKHYGSVQAVSIIKSGSSAAYFLKGDGSHDNNTYLYGGSMSSGFIPRMSGAATTVNSNIHDNGTNVTVGGTVGLYKFTTVVNSGVNFGVGVTDIGGTNNAVFISSVNNSYTPVPMGMNASIMTFATGFTEAARIDGSQNFIVGATSGAYKFTLNGQPGANGYTAFTNYSDARLKENILDLNRSELINRFMKLRPVTFNYNEKSGYDKETRSRTIGGFVAQELKEIFPEMVGAIMVNEEEYYDTNLSNLPLYTVMAVQELSKQIELLKSEIKLLKN
ncbi:tail fiber domain-containing protein [Aquirufa ecclesiirivi]|uniref:tail fiber domain-containing protein n=1 Tax=Aquirufa ecclesiirivi TaxID=2715124 RepID=UPI003BAEAC95